jgi:hypothetical protein
MAAGGSRVFSIERSKGDAEAALGGARLLCGAKT